MKTLKLFIFSLLFTCCLAQAQVSVNVNIGTPPAWGPAGYTDVRYYYLPDIDTYYDVSNEQYIYVSNGKWIRATTLPVAYRSYNLYRGYKVVLTDYRGATPYAFYNTHKVKYPHGYRGAPQKNIGLPPGQAKKLQRSKAVVVKQEGHKHGKSHPGKGKGKGKD